MGTVLDVQDLPDDRVEYLKNLIVLWRKQEQNRQHQEKKAQKKEAIVFSTHDSKPLGPITRDEIYDHL